VTDSPFGLLGELQQLAASRVDELIALGCPDRRSPSLVRDVESLARRNDILEIEQRHAVLDAIPALQERCARLDDALPASLVHGDLHAGNWTRHADGRWLIFDWTDACVAHPFVDLGVLPTKDERVRAARLRSYLDAWAVEEDERLVSDAVAVASAHHAVSYQRIVDGVRGDDGPSWHPAVRSFLDRMLHALAE
jgi:aminoglycoside phosphotransferase (APT) family kinase protein